jgi:hypothetical protein
MSDFQQNIALLVLGWLFGLLSPAIIEAIRYRKGAKRGRTAIICELKELSSVLALATFSARKAAGSLDRSFLQWFKSRISADNSEGAKSVLGIVESMLALSDSELLEGATSTATPTDSEATMLQHYPAPLLDTRVSALWTFDTTFQRKLLEIHRDLALLDGIVELSRQYFFLTFKELTSVNHRLITDNLANSYRNYAHRAQIVVNKIIALESSRGA